MSESLSRRSFLERATLTTGLIGAAACAEGSDGPAEEPQASPDLPILSAAGYRFPRFEALFDGRVQIEGFELRVEQMAIGDMNTHVFSGPQTLDFSEVGLHPFMLAYANDGFRDYTLLPVFPLRVFRHKSVFIRTDRGIREPADLIGRAVATPGYASTSLTWLRGIFEHEYGVGPQDVDWVFSAGDSSADVSGAASAQEQFLPDGVSVRRGPSGMDESDLLESGQVDALFHAAEPRAYVQGNPIVARLFSDYRAVEREYYARTGIFPIMHAVAIKRSLLGQRPELARAVFDAYSEAKRIAYGAMSRIGWAADMLPWYGQEFEETRTLMGTNFYSYGIDANRSTLEALFQYSHEQGLASRRLTVEELFDPAGLELFEGS